MFPTRRELQNLIGVSAEYRWTVGSMFWTYHVVVTALDGRKWVFNLRSIVLEGSRKQEMGELINRVLRTVAQTPEQLRERYNAEGSKYCEQSGREGYWLSEFNIIRDSPVLSLGNNRCASPFPTYALTRAIDCFYYDLLSEFARRKVASGATDNPTTTN